MGQSSIEFKPHPTVLPDEGGRPRRRRRAVRLAGYVAGVVVGVAALAFALAATHGIFWSKSADDAAANASARWQRPAVSDRGLANSIGVRIAQVAVTGGGGLVDLRYQVVDPARASAVHDRDTPPALISEANGVVVNDLLMGHQHKGRLKGGQTYYLIFDNPGNLVERGSRVTVLLGDASVRHVLVR